MPLVVVGLIIRRIFAIFLTQPHAGSISSLTRYFGSQSEIAPPPVQLGGAH